MISRITARAGIAHLSTAIAELTAEWADTDIAGDGEVKAAAVAARLVESALVDIGALTRAVQVLARWADEGE